jgi:type IV pilus assembly protein PilE
MTMPINCSRARGFTLIEAMIVVAIVAILAAIAYPSYTSQMRKGKRAEGKAKLLQVQQRLERFYTDNQTYTIDVAPLFGLGAGATVYSGDNNDAASPYRIVVTAPTAPATIANAYTLTAQRNTGYSDPDCGDLTLTSTGTKGATGANPSRCW